MSESRTLGLIAGDGCLPHELARALRRRGDRVHAVAIRHLTDPTLEAEVDSLEWLHLGEVDALLASLESVGVREAVMAGKVSKDFLFQRRGELHPDPRALRLLSSLSDHRDDSILGLLAAELEKVGVSLLSQAGLAPELLLSEGPLGRSQPTPDEQADVEFAWPVARALGALDVGQTVVAKNRSILAVEAMEGTDEAIRRGGKLGGEGASVIKVAKPAQDLRFDVPVVGPGTLESMVASGARVLACEAGATLVVGRKSLIHEADLREIAVVGVPSDGRFRVEQEEGSG